VQNVRSKSHELDVLRRAVLALSVHDRPLKHVAELRSRAEVVGTHKVDHAPVLEQVILQRVAGEYDTTPAQQFHYQIITTTTSERTTKTTTTTTTTTTNIQFHSCIMLSKCKKPDCQGRHRVGNRKGSGNVDGHAQQGNEPLQRRSSMDLS